MNLIKKILLKLGIIPKPFFTRDIYKNTRYNIGDYTYGSPQVLYDYNQSNLTIGKFCSFAHNIKIFLGGNHRTDWITTYPFMSIPIAFPESSGLTGHPSSKGDVTIGNDVWIGYDTTIMSGVKIGNGAVIAAASVVTKNIGAYEIWGGNPAKFIKKRFDDDTIQNLEQTAWWDWDIEKIRENVELLCSSNVEMIFLKGKEINKSNGR